MQVIFNAELPEWLRPGSFVVWVRPKWEDSSKQVRQNAVVTHVVFNAVLKSDGPTINDGMVWIQLCDNTTWIPQVGHLQKPEVTYFSVNDAIAGKLEPAWLPIWHLKKCDHGKQVEVKCDDGSVGMAQYDHPCALKFGKITTGNPVEWRHVYG